MIRPQRHPGLLDASQAALMVVDIQKVLLPYIWEKEKLVQNVGYMLEIARIHKLPTILTEHNPKGLGVTDESVVRINRQGDIEVRRADRWDVIGGLLGGFEERVQRETGLDWA